MAKQLIALGHNYALSSADGQKMLAVEAGPCGKPDLFRFRFDSGYVRILQNGAADVKGGGGEWCHFSVELHDSGCVSLVRGPFRLAAGDDHNFLTGTSKDTPPAADALWTVEEKGAPLPLIVRLQQNGLQFGPFIRENRPDGKVLLRGSDGGYLRITPGSGAVDAKGGGGQPCQFIIGTEGNCISLQNVVEPNRSLGVNSWGALTGCEVDRSQQMFQLETASPEEPLQIPTLIGHKDFDEGVDLTGEERRTFIEDGFIIIRGAVPASLVAAALARINAALLVPGSVTKDEDGAVQFCPGTGKEDAIQALLHATPLWTLAQRLLGRGCVARGHGAQMALRAPHLGMAPLSDDSIPPKQWHIDGMGKGKHSPFSLLLGVALTEQSQPNVGNLVAFRGSHHVLQPLLRGEIDRASNMFSDEGGSVERKPALSGGQQILLQPGDAVMLHQKVAHRVGVNLSPHIRYQTYFRLSHVDHARNLEDGSLLDDLWGEYEGLLGDIATTDSEGPQVKARKIS